MVASNIPKPDIGFRIPSQPAERKPLDTPRLQMIGLDIERFLVLLQGKLELSQVFQSCARGESCLQCQNTRGGLAGKDKNVPGTAGPLRGTDAALPLLLAIPEFIDVAD